MRMSIRKDGTGTLYYQVIHCRATRLIHSGFSLRASEWDADHETVAMSKVTEFKRLDYLLEVKEALEKELGKLEKIVKRLERNGKTSYSVADVVNEYVDNQGDQGLIAFGLKLISQLETMGKSAMAERYRYVMNRL